MLIWNNSSMTAGQVSHGRTRSNWTSSLPCFIVDATIKKITKELVKRGRKCIPIPKPSRLIYHHHPILTITSWSPMLVPDVVDLDRLFIFSSHHEKERLMWPLTMIVRTSVPNDGISILGIVSRGNKAGRSIDIRLNPSRSSSVGCLTVISGFSRDELIQCGGHCMNPGLPTKPKILAKYESKQVGRVEKVHTESLSFENQCHLIGCELRRWQK